MTLLKNHLFSNQNCVSKTYFSEFWRLLFFQEIEWKKGGYFLPQNSMRWSSAAAQGFCGLMWKIWRVTNCNGQVTLEPPHDVAMHNKKVEERPHWEQRLLHSILPILEGHLCSNSRWFMWIVEKWKLSSEKLNFCMNTPLKFLGHFSGTNSWQTFFSESLPQWLKNSRKSLMRFK